MESVSHVFTCKGAKINKEYEYQMQLLNEHLQTTTSVHIQKGINIMINHMRTGDNMEFTETFPSEIEKLIRTQAQLGLKATLGGFWHKEWLL